jgi:hypothetical protein
MCGAAGSAAASGILRVTDSQEACRICDRIGAGAEIVREAGVPLVMKLRTSQ